MSAVMLSYQASASFRLVMRTSRLSPTLLMKESTLSIYQASASFRKEADAWYDSITADIFG